MLRMLGRERSFEPGTLRERIRQQAEQALASGALVPIATETAVVPDGGIEFQVRVASSLRRKDRSDREQARTGRNPFLPYDLHPSVLGLENAADALYQEIRKRGYLGFE